MRLHALLTYAEEVGKEKVGGGGWERISRDE